MLVITPKELKELIDSNAEFQIIDVREPYENEDVNINGLLIPMGEIMTRHLEISRTKKVIIHCKSGKRAAAVIDSLKTQHGFNNLYNLEGGIEAFCKYIGSDFNF